jgi:hypothetical protein
MPLMILVDAALINRAIKLMTHIEIQHRSLFLESLYTSVVTTILVTIFIFVAVCYEFLLSTPTLHSQTVVRIGHGLCNLEAVVIFVVANTATAYEP